MRSEIRQWFANHPWALSAAFSLMFANAILVGTGFHPAEIGAVSHGP